MAPTLREGHICLGAKQIIQHVHIADVASIQVEHNSALASKMTNHITDAQCSWHSLLPGNSRISNIYQLPHATAAHQDNANPKLCKSAFSEHSNEAHMLIDSLQTSASKIQHQSKMMSSAMCFTANRSIVIWCMRSDMSVGS